MLKPTIFVDAAVSVRFTDDIGNRSLPATNQSNLIWYRANTIAWLLWPSRKFEGDRQYPQSCYRNTLLFQRAFVVSHG